MKNFQLYKFKRNHNQFKWMTLVTILILNGFGCGEQNSPKGAEQSETEAAYNKYENGKKDGLWREYENNNRLISEGYFKNGKANGLMKWYHEKGHLAGEGLMKDGLRDGIWKVYGIEDGKLVAEVIFKDDKEIGIKSSYHTNGQLKQENTWKEYQLIAKKCWDENGTEIECIED